MMQAPKARRSGLATLPFRFVNRAAQRFSISGQGIRLGFLYPTVAFLQIHAHRLFEIRQADLAIAVTIHMLQLYRRLASMG